jgi:hypothetical protein
MEATDTCTVCNRAICREHTKVSAGTVMCVECFARNQEEALRGAGKGAKGSSGAAKGAMHTPGRQEQDDRWNDPSWPFMYRHMYYASSGYHPFYSGSYYDNYYDGYDLRSFHGHSGTHFHDDDGNDAGGFYDS